MLAVGQHQLAGGRVDPLDAALRVQRDAPLGEERRLVGGGETLVGQAGHDHRQAAALEPIQRGAGSARAFQRVDVVGRVGEAGQRVGRQLGTERDH